VLSFTHVVHPFCVALGGVAIGIVVICDPARRALAGDRFDAKPSLFVWFRQSHHGNKIIRPVAEVAVAAGRTIPSSQRFMGGNYTLRASWLQA
jgi:hypothetical protein